MTSKKIVSITPNGKPWGEPPNGPMYPFKIEFDDGMVGVANAKVNPPAYKVGDLVGVEVTGQDQRGNNKLKIDRKWPEKNPQGGGSAFTPSQPQNVPNATQSAANDAPNPHSQPMINGQTVGIAIGRAVEALSSDFPVAQKLDGTFVKAVYELASQLVRVSYKLEHGKLSPPAVIKLAQELAANHGFTPSASSVGAPTAGNAEDVPF